MLLWFFRCVLRFFCDPGSKPTVVLASFALRFWQQFTEIPRLQCPWHTHPCRTQLRGNRWRVLWCCRIKAVNPVPAISVAGVEFIVCDTKLTTDTYLVPYNSQNVVNIKHISLWKCFNVHNDNFSCSSIKTFFKTILLLLFSKTCSYFNIKMWKATNKGFD